jgi:hypothetical protein
VKRPPGWFGSVIYLKLMEDTALTNIRTHRIVSDCAATRRGRFERGTISRVSRRALPWASLTPALQTNQFRVCDYSENGTRCLFK